MTKTPKKPAKTKAQRPGELFGLDSKITPLKKENPYRKGTKAHGVYNIYKKGMTVAEAIEAGATRAHVRFDLTTKKSISVK